MACSTLNCLPIWPDAVCAIPTMATKLPMPSTTPSRVSADRPGRWSSPASASLPRSRAWNREGGTALAPRLLIGEPQCAQAPGCVIRWWGAVRECRWWPGCLRGRWLFGCPGARLRIRCLGLWGRWLFGPPGARLRIRCLGLWGRRSGWNLGQLAVTDRDLALRAAGDHGVMRDDQQRGSAPVQRFEQVGELDGGGAVQVAGGLVTHQQ